MGEAWTVLSTVLSGICIFGGIGFGLDRLFGTRPFLLAAGLVVGAGLGVYLVYAKYMGAAEQALTPPVPSVPGWSKSAPVGGAAGEPHPPTPELAQWPNVKHAPEAPHAS